MHVLHNMLSIFFLIITIPPRSTLFPYTTLFRSHAIVIPFDDSRSKTGSYWVTGTDEAKCWHLVRGVLTDPNIPKLFQKDRKSTRLNSSHEWISYAVFCLKKKNNKIQNKIKYSLL